MQDSRKPKRFWLFAPFVGLLALAILAFGLWHGAGLYATSELAANGLQWRKITRTGFPARLTLNIDAPRYTYDGLAWQNDQLTATWLPFNTSHIVLDFIGAHRIKTAKAHATVTHQGTLMSFIANSGSFARSSFEIHRPALSGRFSNQPVQMSADYANIHMRRTRNPGQLETAFHVKNLHQTYRRISGGAPIERLEGTIHIPQTMLTRGAQAGDSVTFTNVTLELGALTLKANGTVQMHPSGNINGKLDLDLINLGALLYVLEDINVIGQRDRKRLSRALTLSTLFGGNTNDRISLPLQWRNGRTQLLGIRIGAAPKWK